MVRKCQVDDSLQVYWDSLLRDRKQAEIGLLLGSVGDTQKDFLYGIVQTLGQDDLKVIICEEGEDNQSKSKKGRGSNSKIPQPVVTINVDLLVDHALAITRQLPGGVSVAGLYMLAPDGGLQAAAEQLCQVLESFRTVDKGDSDFFVFHVPSNSKNVSLRVVPPESRVYSDMKPCDIKYGQTIQQLIAFNYSYGVNLGQIPSKKSTTLKDCLVEVISMERQQITNLYATLQDSQIQLQGDDLLTDLVPQDATSLTNPCVLDLYSPSYMIYDGDEFDIDQTMVSQKVSGYGNVQGCIHGISYINRRATANQALNVIKQDLMGSLQTRVDMLIEDAMQAEEEDAGPEPTEEKTLNQILFETDLSSTQSLILPRKVAFPWQSGLQFVDYLLDGETLDYTIICADEANLGSIQTQQIQEWEQVAHHPNDAMQWTPFIERNNPKQNATKIKKQNLRVTDPTILVLVFGLIGGLIAILFYFIFLG